MEELLSLWSIIGMSYKSGHLYGSFGFDNRI